MWIGKRDLDGEISLCRSDIGKGLVAGPRDLTGDGQVRAAAEAGHGGKEDLQASRVAIQGGEKMRAAVLARLILRQPRANGFSEAGPERVEAGVQHLERDVG